MDLSNEQWGMISVSLAMIAYLAYIYSLRKGTMKPHVFSWALWGLLMGIGFFAQLSEGAGAGAWFTGLGAIMSSVIAVYAFFRGEKNITRTDWIAFLSAITAIPIWYFTKNAMWAVVIVSFIDGVAYYPTFRKSWNKPFEEPVFNYVVGCISLVATYFALENINVTTALYPAVIFTANALLSITLFIRRYKLGRTLWPA